MYNGTEGREIEGVCIENEGVESENEVVENKFLTSELKGYFLRNTPTINYNDGRYNRISMGCNSLIFGYYSLHYVAKAHINAVNDSANFVEPNTPSNIIKKDNILTQ